MGEEEYTCISITTCPCINTSYVLWHWLVVCFVLSLQQVLKIFVYVFAICFKWFFHLILFIYQSLLVFCQKSKNKWKVENPKSLISIVVYCHKHVLPCTFVLIALCIYENSLFFMHSYHCGKNLDIYVIVANRSSNLSWMISQWFCWSWNLHRHVPIYLPTFFFA